MCIRDRDERVSKRRQAAFATPTRSTQKNQRQVAILEPTHVGEPDATSENAEGLYALQGEMVDGSINTQDLPSTITDLDPAEDQEQILMLTRQLRDNQKKIEQEETHLRWHNRDRSRSEHPALPTG